MMIPKIVFLLILLKFTLIVSDVVSYRDVTITQGLVRGFKQPGENVVAFQSIPYATVPTGNKMFAAPLPPPTWNDTFEAVDKKIICQQPRRENTMDSNIQIQCLIVNIFVPDGEPNNLPVVVIIHGGAFLFGFGNRQTPKNLVKTGKVIAVTFNYRVGPLGFLCLGTKKVPGNAGMKDQVALLRWLQDNIDKFGGNPNDVTIFGCSAGSSSADILLLSKMAKGLFHKIIAGSGSNINALSVQMDPIENAKVFAQQLGFNQTDDLKALEKFYLDTPYEILANYSINILKRTDSIVLFSPCVEKDIGQAVFLHDSPIKILENKDFTTLPMLYGFCEMEGLFRIDFFDTWKIQMTENFTDFLPPDFGRSLKEREILAKYIKNFYFGDGPVTDNSVLQYIHFFTDVLFANGMLRSAKLQLKAGNKQLYLYEYSFVDESVDLIRNSSQRGAEHCAQETAVLDLPNENELSQEYQNMKKIVRDLWVNFILTGEPVPQGSSYPKWPPSTPQMSYMSLNSTLEYREALIPERVKFWDTLSNEYYICPAPPNPRNDGFRIFSTICILYTFLILICTI